MLPRLQISCFINQRLILFLRTVKVHKLFLSVINGKCRIAKVACFLPVIFRRRAVKLKGQGCPFCIGPMVIILMAAHGRIRLFIRPAFGKVKFQCPASCHSIVYHRICFEYYLAFFKQFAAPLAISIPGIAVLCPARLFCIAYFRVMPKCRNLFPLGNHLLAVVTVDCACIAVFRCRHILNLCMFMNAALTASSRRQIERPGLSAALAGTSICLNPWLVSCRLLCDHACIPLMPQGSYLFALADNLVASRAVFLSHIP